MILQKRTIEELLSYQEHVVCFGSGKAFDKLLELFEDTFLVSKILYIVENDSAKWGKSKYIKDKKIPIVSPDYFMSQDKDGIICLITLKTYGAILEQYQEVQDCNKLRAVWYLDIMQEYCTSRFDETEIPVTLRRSDKMLIPKVIHYCWFGKADIPYENRVWMESWEKYCPDYKIVQWNEDNYDVTANQYMLEAYQAKRWGFATDYARLDIVYQQGGIYLDTDVELVKNIDELLYQPAFMGWEDGLRVNTGLGFGAEKKMELFKEMRDYYDALCFVRKDGTHDLTACPTYQTRVLQRYGLVKNGGYQVIGDIAILPTTYLCGKSTYVLHDTRTKHTFGVHQFQESWSRP